MGRDGVASVRRAVCSATGIRIARAPTFLVIIDRSATATVNIGASADSRFTRASSGRSSASISPLRAKAALTTRAVAMITTTSFLKPSNADFAGTTPISTPASTEHRAIRS